MDFFSENIFLSGGIAYTAHCVVFLGDDSLFEPFTLLLVLWVL